EVGRLAGDRALDPDDVCQFEVLENGLDGRLRGVRPAREAYDEMTGHVAEARLRLRYDFAHGSPPDSGLAQLGVSEGHQIRETRDALQSSEDPVGNGDASLVVPREVHARDHTILGDPGAELPERRPGQPR